MQFTVSPQIVPFDQSGFDRGQNCQLGTTFLIRNGINSPTALGRNLSLGMLAQIRLKPRFFDRRFESKSLSKTPEGFDDFLKIDNRGRCRVAFKFSGNSYLFRFFSCFLISFFLPIESPVLNNPTPLPRFWATVCRNVFSISSFVAGGWKPPFLVL